MERHIRRHIDVSREAHTAFILVFLISLYALTSPQLAVSALKALEHQYTTLLATGDVMLGRNVYQKIREYGDLTWPFQKINKDIASDDIVLINLESPLVEECPESNGGLIFCAPPATVAGLVYIGVDVANVANNHRYDYGELGYLSTLHTLEMAGIHPSDENNVVIIEQHGVRFGFIGFNLVRQSAQMIVPSKSEMTKKIQDAKKKVDVLIVSMHWGDEYQHSPSPAIIGYAHAIIDSGADIIIGNHPHVIQEGEIYHGKHIVYSLGNFVFDQPWVETKKGRVIRFVFEGKELMEEAYLPITIVNGGQPQLDGS